MSEYQIGLLLIRHVKISGKPKNREFNISIVYLLYCVTPVCRSTQCTVSCKYLMRREMMWWDILMLESLEERKVQCVTFIWGKNCQAQIQVQEKYNVWLFLRWELSSSKSDPGQSQSQGHGLAKTFFWTVTPCLVKTFFYNLDFQTQ